MANSEIILFLNENIHCDPSLAPSLETVLMKDPHHISLHRNIEHYLLPLLIWSTDKTYSYYTHEHQLIVKFKSLF